MDRRNQSRSRGAPVMPRLICWVPQDAGKFVTCCRFARPGQSPSTMFAAVLVIACAAATDTRSDGLPTDQPSPP